MQNKILPDSNQDSETVQSFTANTTKTMLDYALAYAKKDYPVFPCHSIIKTGKCSCGGQTDCSPGKHPLTPNGYKDATTDETQIRLWWQRWPWANIALDIASSGLLVTDVDRHPDKPDGVRSFSEVQQGRSVPGPLGYTGGGGLHVITKRPEGKISGKPAPGIEAKVNGYIMLPPSLHESGKRYQWKERRSLLECEPQDPPDWLQEFVRGKSKKAASRKKAEKKAETLEEYNNPNPVNYPKSSAELIRRRCLFLKAAFEDAATLDEPSWYQGIGILANTEESPDIVHEFSRAYPTYTVSETQKKLEHWKEDGKGSPSCETIQEKCGDEYCRNCSYNGKIKNPIVLGYASRNAQKSEAKLIFPVEVLPSVFQQFVVEMAAALQCPVDYIACAILAVVSILLGGFRRIQLGPEWNQPANLWLVLVGSPSAKKSPALEKALKALRKIETRLSRKYQQELARFEMAMREYELALKQWKQEPNGDPPLKPQKPMLERLTTSDTTVEALGLRLSENPQGIGLVCDELSSWARSMNQYKGNKGADRSHYLAMWNNARLTIDRKGDKEPLIVESPFLTLVGGIQPDILPEIAGQGDEDGMKERFLFCYPLPNRDIPQDGLSVSLKLHTAMEVCYQKIFDERPTEQLLIPLSEGAQEVFLQARQEWHGLMQLEGFPSSLEGYYGKMPSHMGRLALTLHEMKRVCGEMRNEVSEDTMRQAKALADYFLNHAHVAFGLIRQTYEEQQVEKLAQWIQKKGLVAVTPRDLQQGKPFGRDKMKASQARSLLRLLHDYGYGYWQANDDRFIFYQEP